MGLNANTIAAILLAVFFLEGCAPSKQYERRYRRAWRKVVNSQAWKDALASGNAAATASSDPFCALPGFPNKETVAYASGPVMEKAFLERYPSLVSRAYFRIIAEAEAADSRLSGEYQRLYRESRTEEGRENKRLQRQLQAAERRYTAHREMLEGLRAWKAFNRFGSDDLDFFLEEYLEEAFKLYQKGAADEQLIAFLMVKLADLYHHEEQQLKP